MQKHLDLPPEHSEKIATNQLENTSGLANYSQKDWDKLEKDLRIRYGRLLSEDAVQDACVNALVFLRKNQEIRHFHAWLNKIASNTALNIIRSLRPVESPSLEYFNTVDKASSCLSNMISHDDGQIVREAIETLSEGVKEAVMDRYFDQLSYDQISEKRDVPVGTVRSRIHRGKSQVKEYLISHNFEKE